MAKNILKMKITRNDAGARITLQSDLNWGFMHASGGSDLTIAGVACRPIRPDAIPLDAVPGVAFCIHANPVLFHENKVNLAFLGAKQLVDGVTFLIPPTAPMSSKKLQDFAKNFKEISKTAYRQFMKPVDIEVVITTSETENETA